MYEPDIYINEELMESLTLEQKKEFVDSSPTKVFDINPNTQQVAHIFSRLIVYVICYRNL